MRIRKHANTALFSRAFRTCAVLQQHVCQLNMSPWDLEPFLLLPDGRIDPNLFRPIPENEGDEENEEKEAATGNRNGVLSAAAAAADVNGSVEKEERKEDEKEKKVRRKKAVALKGEGIITSTKMTKRKNGRSKPGKKIEERVDSPSEDIDDGGGDDYQPPQTQIKSEDGVGIGGERRRRRRRKKEERGALSPKMDFYYYSGFGPLWGKKRGDGSVGNTENAVRVIPPSSSSSPSDHDRDDECHEDEEDDYDNNVNVIDSEWKMEERVREKKKNKRVGRRKRVKARSLKSLL